MDKHIFMVYHVNMQKALSLLVQSNDCEEVELRISKRLGRKGNSLCRIFSGQRSEYSCVLYIDGLAEGVGERILQIINEEFEVLDPEFNPNEERGAVTTNTLLKERRRKNEAHRFSILNTRSSRISMRDSSQLSSFPYDHLPSDFPVGEN